MIQPVPATRSPSPVAASRAAPSPNRFALSLAAVQGDEGEEPSDADPVADGSERQEDAGDGTDLPNADAPLDPRLAWLTLPTPATPLPVPLVAVPAGGTAVIAPAITAGPVASAGTPPVPLTAPTAVPVGSTAPAVTQALVASPPPADVPLPIAPPMPTQIAPTAPAASSPSDAPAALPTTVPATADTPPTPPPALASGPLPIALPDPARPAVATPALQAFAGALRAGWEGEHRAKRDDPDPLAPAGTATLAPLETVRHAVAATGAAQEQTLDTRREHWPATMIDHIEALRDAADATSSRIRIVPDALGAIDLSVKRDGDTLHVHFNAEQAATRTLLADAQPRLAQIAEARGLRLGDTNVSGGSGSGGDQPQRRTPPQPAPVFSTPAPATATIAAVADDDTRIA